MEDYRKLEAYEKAVFEDMVQKVGCVFDLTWFLFRDGALSVVPVSVWWLGPSGL